MSVLYPYQVEIANRNNKFDIACKSRQIGYTFTNAYKMLKSCILKDRDQLIVSASLRQSKRVMYFIEKFFTAFQKIKSLRNLKLVEDTQTIKRFRHNDKQIVCLPANPDTIRGFSGDVLLDEFALYKDDKKIFESIFPTITLGYNISICSTPLGRSNLFYKIFSDEQTYKDYARYIITIHDAISKGLKADIELLKRNFDTDSFKQEYECEFLDESTSVFTYELLKSCIEEYEPLDIKGNSTMGIDVGRTQDRTAIATITENNGIFYYKDLEVLHNKPFDIQKETIRRLYSSFDCSKGLIDKGLIGLQLSEELSKEFYTMAGIQFTNNLKNELISFTKKLMEQKKFKIIEDRDLINDFHSIKKSVSTSNTVSFNSERTDKGHSDRAWAFMLALYCKKKQTVTQWSTY